MNDLFKTIDFETISSCNRTCPTCIRNSHPDKRAVQSWFGEYHMNIMNNLKNTGGRLQHPYCATCPRP